MKDWQDLRTKDPCVVIGLMSGTSVDGVDAVVAEISGEGAAVRIRELGFVSRPYPETLRQEILAVAGGEARRPEDLCRLDHAIGEAFGEVAREAVRAAGLQLGDVDLIGSHGQTIFHDPDAGHTWQIGEPSRIASALGAPVVSDFRRADQALGGQGAPLVPLLDALVFRHPEKGRVLLNIGGMANVTVLPAGRGPEGVFAFDTGPGNVLIDEFLALATSGKSRFDEDGRLAAQGTVNRDLLEGFLEHPYFYEQPPKSTGREVFGEAFVALTLGEWRVRGDRLEDVVATLTEFTALSITESIREYVLPEAEVAEVLVSGGGTHNATLMRRITEELEGMSVDSLESAGFSADAKEALAFALLARETVCGRPGNVPGATGAREPGVLGVVTAAPETATG